MSADTGHAPCIVGTLLYKIAEHECMHCGECVFGYEGATQAMRILKDISLRRGRHGDIELLAELACFMSSQCMCEKGDSLGLEMADVLVRHREEIERHITRRQCMAGTCEGYLGIYILPDQCDGCDECADACDVEAILGKRGFIHVIDQDACMQCGDCLEVCKSDAIVKAGGPNIPRCPKKSIRCKK